VRRSVCRCESICAPRFQLCHSGMRPLGAGPESITPAGSMDSGLVLRTPRNDERKISCALHGQMIQFSNNLHSPTQFRVLVAHFARVLLEVPPSSYRGHRECRAPDAPAASRVEKNTRVSHHGHAGSPGIPRAMVLTVYFALSPVTGLVCHRRPQETCKKLASRELDASVGASGPHDFVVRKPRSRQSRRQRPSHPAPNVRDDRETPLKRDGMGGI